MNSKKKQPPMNLGRISTQRDQYVPEGMKLSEVRYVAPHRLTPNPLNVEFFGKERDGSYNELKANIAENGVLVPLIAKEDGTLLAGHNRLSIAVELRKERVPVQYVTQRLSPEDERKLVVNDNLLRRQFTADERLALYRKLYPNFDNRISSAKGRRKEPTETVSGNVPARSISVSKASSKKLDNVQFSEQPDSSPLTATMIARDTHQSVEAVRKQLQRARQQSAAKPSSTKPRIRTQQQSSQGCSKGEAMKQIQKICATAGVEKRVRERIVSIIQSIQTL